MTSFQVEQHIEASPAEVFAMASDFESAANNITAIERIELLSDGPVGVGTRFKETRKMMGRTATEEMEVTEFEAPNFYTIASNSCGCRFSYTMRCEPKDNGTKLSMTMNVQPLTFFAKVMSPFTRMMIKSCVKESQKDLVDLKDRLEEKAVGASA